MRQSQSELDFPFRYVGVSTRKRCSKGRRPYSKRRASDTEGVHGVVKVRWVGNGYLLG